MERWLKQELRTGTIKNRMNCLRWWAARVSRSNVIARSNEAYAIPNRLFVAQASKARELTDGALAKVTDAHVRLSLELQRAFGLRHAYAQERYQELTGWAAPAAGGPSASDLTPL